VISHEEFGEAMDVMANGLAYAAAELGVLTESAR
jgi:hypothetical protein